MEISKITTFDSAHFLNNIAWDEAKNREVYGKCWRLHGHRYKLIVVVKGDIKADGMLVNFVDLKKIIQDVVNTPYDHKLLNECDDFMGIITTVENISSIIWNKLQARIANMKMGVRLSELVLYETENSFAVIRESDNNGPVST